MERILTDINAMTGVVGSFVCDEEGQLLASAMPDSHDAERLARVGRTAADPHHGALRMTRRRLGGILLLAVVALFGAYAVHFALWTPLALVGEAPTDDYARAMPGRITACRSSSLTDSG